MLTVKRDDYPSQLPLDSPQYARFRRHCELCPYCSKAKDSSSHGLCRTGRYILSTLLIPRSAQGDKHAS